jgi:hypothetical protein
MLAGALAGPPEAPHPAAVLDTLAARSLIILARGKPTSAYGASGPVDGPRLRVRLHPLLREFARARWVALPAELRAATLAALLEAVADFVRTHGGTSADEFAVLAAEEELIAGAIQQAAAAQVAPQAVITAVDCLTSYLYIGGHWRLGRELRVLQLEACSRVGNRRGEGAALNGLGALARRQLHYEEAARYFEAALIIRHEVGDQAGEGTTLSSLGLLA